VGGDSKCESIVSNVREGINHLLQTILPNPPWITLVKTGAFTAYRDCVAILCSVLPCVLYTHCKKFSLGSHTFQFTKCVYQQ